MKADNNPTPSPSRKGTMHSSQSLGLKVRIDVVRLVDILHAKRVDHVKRFEAAMEAYWSAKQEAFKEAVLALVAKEEPNLPYLPRPKNYAQVYDNAIAMLNMCENGSVDLSVSDYDKLVNDQWEWKSDFDGITSQYLGGAQ